MYRSLPPEPPFEWHEPRVPGIIGFGIPEYATATLVVELLCDDCKFKIEAVTSC